MTLKFLPTVWFPAFSNEVGHACTGVASHSCGSTAARIKFTNIRAPRLRVPGSEFR